MSARAPSGLASCGDLEWGAHICHLYETREDLLDTLVPFFAEALANHEKCVWVTAAPLDASEAQTALTARRPDLEQYMARGQIVIVDHSQWHTRTGALDADSLLNAWIAAEQDALAEGYSGLRATGNIAFLRSREHWRDFERYEARVNEVFAGRRLIGLCSYHLGSTPGSDVLDVIRNHHFALARRDGAWEMIENAEIKLAKQQLAQTNEALEQRVAERTAELCAAVDTLGVRGRELEAALASKDATEHSLTIELADAELLGELSATLLDGDDVGALYQKLVDAAATVMRSEFASMQSFHPERGNGGELELLAHRGFLDEAVRYWTWVRTDSPSICAEALRSRARVFTPDIEHCAQLVGTVDLEMLRRTGIRAAQTTPLWSRTGALVGMISTQWRTPHRPTDRELRSFDILARQAADLIGNRRMIDALRARTQELVDASRHKDEFLATLAHELRNPLAPIRTGLTLLHTGRAEAFDRVVPMMERQLGHMVRMIDDLLDVSRVSRGKVVLRKERVALRTVIDSALETSRPLIEASSHRLDVTVPGSTLWLDADLTRLAQVISNVLNNAAKYTPEGGHIRLVAEAAADEVVVRVADTGIGIPAEKLPKVFDLFAQVEHSLDRSRGGLGIGLSLAKTLLEMHAGSISVTSEGAGQGSTFTLRVPLAVHVPTGERAAPPDSASAAQAGYRVLVVDDNEDGAEMLAMLLEAAGHQTRVVLESPRAISEARAFRPDVVLLDIGMPELNGLDLARLLRKEPGLDGVLLVALTGWGSSEDQERSREAGFDYHLTKPVLPGMLADVLARRTPQFS